jgi:bacterial/archaeal transporter family protein
MASWFGPALIATLLWGAVGVLQKLGSNRVGASSLLIWVSVGYVVAVPALLWWGGFASLSQGTWLLGAAAGFINGLGAWFLFASLQRGAKASVAIPLTALYPVFTILLAFFFLSERLSTRECIGVVLAVCAGAMLSYERTEAPGG